MSDFTDFWLETTKLDLTRIGQRKIDWAAEPERYKHYPDAQTIPLPSPGELNLKPADLWGLLHQRRSVRRFTNAPVTREQLTALLWSCQGVTATRGPYRLRTAPSAGALFPFETYVFINNVEGIGPCLAHLDISDFRLSRVKEGSLADDLVTSALAQKFLGEAPAVFAWTTIHERSAWKYGDRASRYLGLDIGHVCQNLCLGSLALGLSTCAVGAFLDDRLNSLMEIDGKTENVFYLCAVGTEKV